MERYFIVLNEDLINKVKTYEYMRDHIHDLYKKFAEKHGIETKRYYQLTDCLMIDPTRGDEIKFSGLLKKDGAFKVKSDIHKEWVNWCKLEGLKTPHKPGFDLACKLGWNYRYRYRLFTFDGKVYGSFECDCDFKLPEDDFMELKPSEFYKQIGE